jgi:hypothetical protein
LLISAGDLLKQNIGDLFPSKAPHSLRMPGSFYEVTVLDPVVSFATSNVS